MQIVNFKVIKGLIAISALLVFSSACKRDTEPIDGIEVSPSALIFQRNSGDIENFLIKGHSKQKLNRIKISTKEKSGYTVVRLDSSFSGREYFSMNWEYLFENAASDYDLSVFFTLSDESGKNYSTDRLVKVKISDPLLKEYAGIKLNASGYGKPDAINLADITVRNAELNAANTLDILDDSSGQTIGNKRWISPAGGRFMRFNSFNYAGASFNNLSAAITTGTFVDRIDHISQGDIILYRRMDDSVTIEAAISVIDIVSQPGDSSYYYNLSIKKKP